MNLDWKHLGRIPCGGAVLQIVPDGADQFWAASPAGLFVYKHGHWKTVVGGFPYAQVNAILAVKGQIFAAGLPEGIVRAVDGGDDWQQCYVEQTSAPVTCLAASPRCDRDGVLLAGTARDGLLRSTDRGRFWNLANFGLREFTILSLVAAGTWSRSKRPVPEEIAFAGTQAGVYRSPNGGRAWKFLGLEDMVVLALAASPDFDQDRVVIAGTEEEGLFYSSDGGISWQRIELGLQAPVSVNALCWDRLGSIWAAIAGHGLWVSSDRGVNWTQQPEAPEDILCLVDTSQGLAAGLAERGLAWFSNETRQWQIDDEMAARRFEWLLPLPMQVAEPAWFASGAMETPWVSQDGGQVWNPVQGPPTEGIILDMAVSSRYLWAGSSEGLWRLPIREPMQQEESWQLVVESQAAVTTLAVRQELICAGTEAGSLWISEDEGSGWQQVNLPEAQALALKVEISPDFGSDRTLWVAAGMAGQRSLWVWRCQMTTTGKPDWKLILDERSDWQSLSLTCSGVGENALWIGLGSTVLHRVDQTWQRAELPTQGAPIHTLMIDPSGGVFLAVAGGQVFTSPDGLDWQLQPGLQDLAVADIQVIIDPAGRRTLYALTLEGQILSQLLRQLI
ncbi:MAG: hypothetical protein JXB15_08505 [Anaerolineales bacterium]|nr:hypothetical protein [Anaerolineales bacterium]